MKVAYAKYDKNSVFGILADTFPYENLPSATCILWYDLVPSIKNIRDNIYQYCLWYCANGGPQVKRISFDRSFSIVIASPTLRIIFDIAATYHITMSTADVYNAFRNSLKDSS